MEKERQRFNWKFAVVLSLIVLMILIVGFARFKSGNVVEVNKANSDAQTKTIDKNIESKVKISSESVQKCEVSDEDKAEIRDETIEIIEDRFNIRFDDFDAKINRMNQSIPGIVSSAVSNSGRGFRSCVVVDAPDSSREAGWVCSTRQGGGQCIMSIQERYKVTYSNANCEEGRNANTRTTILGYETHLTGCNGVQIRGSNSHSCEASGGGSLFTSYNDRVVCCTQ